MTRIKKFNENVNYNEYVEDTLSHMKRISSERELDLDDGYLDWFKQQDDFKDMIEIEILNHRTPKQAAESIMTIWN